MSASNEYLTLKQAASRLGTDEEHVLLLAAAGEIPIAVWADSWVSYDATVRESGHVDYNLETQRILNKVWLYMRDGYLRQFLERHADEPIEVGGKFRSRPDGAVDRWVKPKPLIRRCELCVRAEDVERIRNESAPTTVESRRATWRSLGKQVAEDMMAKDPRYATKDPRKDAVAYQIKARGLEKGPYKEGTIARWLNPADWKRKNKRA